MKSWRRERMRELSDGVEWRNGQARTVVLANVRARTPIGTPASTKDPNYPITHALQNSVEGDSGDYGVVVGTNKSYAPYVSQGTYDYAHGRGGWTEAEAKEFDSLTDTGDGPGVGRKGMRPRPFLVNGLLASRGALEFIYRRPIEGGHEIA